MEFHWKTGNLEVNWLFTQNVNSRLEKKIINSEKNQAKEEQYSQRNNIELSGTPNIPDVDLKTTAIKICK